MEFSHAEGLSEKIKKSWDEFDTVWLAVYRTCLDKYKYFKGDLSKCMLIFFELEKSIEGFLYIFNKLNFLIKGIRENYQSDETVDVYITDMLNRMHSGKGWIIKCIRLYKDIESNIDRLKKLGVTKLDLSNFSYEQIARGVDKFSLYLKKKISLFNEISIKAKVDFEGVSGDRSLCLFFLELKKLVNQTSYFQNDERILLENYEKVVKKNNFEIDTGHLRDLLQTKQVQLENLVAFKNSIEQNYKNIFAQQFTTNSSIDLFVPKIFISAKFRSFMVDLINKFEIVVSYDASEGYLSFYERKDKLTYQILIDYIREQAGQDTVDVMMDLLKLNTTEYRECVTAIYDALEDVEFADEKDRGGVLFCMEHLRDYYLKDK